ncbi:MAG: DHH family phosphoesterase, partial [Sphaerochaetaceae bacterium]
MNGFPSYPDDFLNKLRQDDCFFIIGHISPDGDCLYSELAMQALLTEMGKVSYVANAGPFERSEIAAQRSQFLQHMPSNLKAKNPTVIVVDCSTPDRIGSFINEINGLSIMVIDHHQSGEPFGDYRFVFSESPSTTLLIQHLFVQLGLKITPNIAHLLFFGFATDSGFFKFLNAGQGTVLRMVADLVDAGVSPNEIYSEMSGGKELAYVQYLGKLIERTQAFFDGRVLCSYCYLSDNDKYNTNDKPSDALYTQLLS